MSDAFRLAKKITMILGIIELMRPMLETIAAHPEHNPIDKEDGEPLPFSEAAAALLKEVDEFFAEEGELQRELERRVQ